MFSTPNILRYHLVRLSYNNLIALSYIVLPSKKSEGAFCGVKSGTYSNNSKIHEDEYTLEGRIHRFRQQIAWWY